MLPQTKSGNAAVLACLTDLRARFHGWLHQDEFGPSRGEQTAALKQLTKSLGKLCELLKQGTVRSRALLNATLRNGGASQMAEALGVAITEADSAPENDGASGRERLWLSRLRKYAEAYLIQSHLADDATDSQIADTALLRKFELSCAAQQLSLAKAEWWLRGYRDVLSSERVRDKIAASRRKGKWTGGSVPLGYDAKDKKLVVNKTEAETVRTIFLRYLELQSFSRLVADLDRRGIVTKRRHTKVPKFNGGIRFTYGPLAHFLKNRIYLGEVHHGGKWFQGEHEAVLDHATFEQVQQLLATNSNSRKAKRAESSALLAGRLYDDKGNRMSPSFSSKNGVRYRF
jgi:hypothetical protein